MKTIKKLMSALLLMSMLTSLFGGISFANEAYIEYEAVIMDAPCGADAIVSMTFDDGNFESASYLNDAFLRYGLKASLMLIAETPTNGAVTKQWQELFSHGVLDAQSHSMTHIPLPSDSWAATNGEAHLANNTEENYQLELIDSKTILESSFGNDVICFAPSNNTLSDRAYEIVQQNYYAVRQGQRGIQSLNPNFGTTPGSWHNLYMQSFSRFASGQALCDMIDQYVENKGWFVSLCHNVREKSGDITIGEAEIFFAYLSKLQSEGKIWCTTFGDATKYVREKQNSTVTEYENANGLFVEVTMNETTEDNLPLDKDIFNYPLTVKAEIPAGWEAVVYTQGENEMVSEAFAENGKNYAYIDVVPNGGAARLSETTVSSTKTAADRALYVENETDSAYEDEILVSGRNEIYSANSNKKAYVKFDISNYSGIIPAKVNIDVTNNNSGKLYVYGTTDTWSADTINYINAPSNDRLGFGADESKLIGTLNITGKGIYSVDITDFATEAKEAGVNEITLIFAKEAAVKNPVLFEDINDASMMIGTGTGGGVLKMLPTPDENYPEGEAGYAMHVKTNLSYQRIRFDLLTASALTTDDIGKKYKLTYYMKSDKTDNSITNALTTSSGSSNYKQNAPVSYTTAGEWQEMTYEFTVTEEAVENAEAWLVIEGFGTSGVENDYYIDNLTLEEINPGDIEFAIISGNYKKTLDWNTEESLNVYSNGAETNNANADIAGSAVSFTDYPVVLSEEANYSGEGGKGLKFAMDNDSWGRYKFYNLFENVLTTEDVGKTFKISFMINPQGHGGYIAVGFMSQTGTYGTKPYESDNVTYVQKNGITKGIWQKVEYTFTVDEGMLVENSSLNNNPALFSIITGSLKSASTSDLNYVYIDDITIEEIITPPYTKTIIFDDRENWNLYATGAEAGNSRDMANNGFSGTDFPFGLSDEENHTTASAGKSFKIAAPSVSYGRYKFFNLFENNLTEEDVGDKYKISFWAKSKSKTGYFSVGFFSQAGAYSGTIYTADTVPSKNLYITELDTWQKVEYDFTVTEAMLASYIPEGSTTAQGAGNNPALFTIMPGSLRSNSTTDINYIYIDDISISHIVDGAEYVAVGNESAIVSTTSTALSEKLTVSSIESSASPTGIKKAYISFTPEYSDILHKATLNLTTETANGETLNVFAITDEALPLDVTYATAPGSNADESMKPEKVYRTVPVAQIAATGETVSIDVTDYVKSQGENECIFSITNESAGSVEYLNLDFEALSFTENLDYTADSAVSITDGSAYVSGNKLTVLNAFGSGNTTAAKGEVYTIKADITTDNDSEVLFGLADASGEIISNINVNLTAGMAQSVELDYLAEEGTNACSLVIEAKQAGFSVDNVKISSNKAVSISKSAELVLETAPQGEIVDTGIVTVNVSVIDGNNVTINGVNKGVTVTEQTERGSVLTISATGNGEFMYWIDTKSKTILSYDETYSYTAGTDRSLAAIYTDDTDAFVTFTSMANKLVASGISGSIEVPENPYVYGYQFDGWYVGGKKQSLTAGETITASENTEYAAGFKKDTTSYKVNINGEVSEYTYNEKVTVSAEAEKDSKTFSYWKRDGVIVSYSTDYNFYVNGDTTAEAVYGENASGGIVLAMANPVLVGTDKIAFFAERDIPTEYEIIETGILMGSTKGLTVVNAPIKATAKSVTNKGQYTVRKANVKSGETWYATAYVIYRDATGSIVTAYSNEVSYTVK